MWRAWGRRVFLTDELKMWRLNLSRSCVGWTDCWAAAFCAGFCSHSEFWFYFYFFLFLPRLDGEETSQRKHQSVDYPEEQTPIQETHGCYWLLIFSVLHKRVESVECIPPPRPDHPWINYNLRSSDLWSTVSTFTCTRINNQSPDHSGRRVNSFMTFAVSDYENSDKHTFFCTIFRLTRCTINVEEADVFSARVHNVTRKSIILKIQREDQPDDRRRHDKWRHVDSMFLFYVTYLERNPTNCLNHGNPSNLNIILKE